MQSLFKLFSIASFLLFTSLHGQLAFAQMPENCQVKEVTDPPRQIVECSFGLTIELEAAAELGFIDIDENGVIRALTVKDGGVLVNAKPNYGRLEIKTPQAIAAVRGTQYIVDPSNERTSVFVLEGVVVVSSALENETGEVVLNAGFGIDVEPGNSLNAAIGSGAEPGNSLEAKKWSDDRKSELLQRFAR